jgi:DNA-binding CsgD family transcriptional regulator
MACVHLTSRQHEVLELHARGMPDKAIAAMLVISERMVRQHLACCRRAYGAVSRSHLVALALTSGCVHPAEAVVADPESSASLAIPFLTEGDRTAPLA